MGGIDLRKKKSGKRILLEIFLGVLVVINLINRYFQAALTNKGRLDDRGHLYKWRFGSVYYMRYGSGSPLILLHELGATGSGYEWHRVAERLAANHTVYVLDLPGCGRSAKPNLLYNSYLYVQLINEFCRDVVQGRLPGQKIQLVTSGNAASFALLATVFNKEMYEKVIMINPPLAKTMNRRAVFQETKMAKRLARPALGMLIFNCFTNKRYIRKQFKQLYYYHPERVEEKDVEAFAEAAHLSGSASRFLSSCIFERTLNMDMKSALRNSSAKLCVIVGEFDSEAGSRVNEYENAREDIKLTVARGTKHLPHMEAPNMMSKIISRYTEE